MLGSDFGDVIYLLFGIIAWLFIIAVLAFLGFKWSAALLFILPILFCGGGIAWITIEDKRKANKGR